jgi:MFS family permease
MGIDSADVLGTIGTLFILMRVGGLAVNLIAGHIADTVNRTYFLLFSLLLATAAFCLPLLVDNVLGWQLYAVVAIIAVSETTSTIASQTLLGQETPPELRGSVTGVYTVIGTTGAMTVNFLGGILFDRFSPVAPFLLVAAINLACFLLCILPGRQSFLSPPQPLEAG